MGGIALAAGEDMEEVLHLIQRWKKKFPKRLDSRFMVVPGSLMRDLEFALHTPHAPVKARVSIATREVGVQRLLREGESQEAIIYKIKKNFRQAI